MNAAIADSIEELRHGPRARWAPPPLQTALAHAELSTVLFIGRRLDSALEMALLTAGHRVHRVDTIDDGRRLLCRSHYRLILADSEFRDCDMVVFAVALKAGHAFASDVPRTAQRLPVVLFDRAGSDSVVLTEAGQALDLTSAQLVPFVVDLLR